MSNLDFLQKLRDISLLFDIGCQITVHDDGVTVEGQDFHPDTNDENVCVVRSYDCLFEMDDDGNFKDTMTPLIEQIEAYNADEDEDE